MYCLIVLWLSDYCLGMNPVIGLWLSDCCLGMNRVIVLWRSLSVLVTIFCVWIILRIVAITSKVLSVWLAKLVTTTMIIIERARSAHVLWQMKLTSKQRLSSLHDCPHWVTVMWPNAFGYRKKERSQATKKQQVCVGTFRDVWNEKTFTRHIRWEVIE